MTIVGCLNFQDGGDNNSKETFTADIWGWHMNPSSPFVSVKGYFLCQIHNFLMQVSK